MPTNSYDLIVIGDDLAGLVAATLCARRGMRTLLLGHDERPARYALGPHKLPIEPVVLPGRGAGALERISRELHLDHALKRKLRDARTTVQLVGPDVRLDLAADAQLLARELGRELPDDAEAALAAWEKAGEIARTLDPLLGADHAFPGYGFWERREVARLAGKAEADAAAWWAQLAEAVGDPTARALLSAPAVLGGRTLDPAPAARARALDLWRTGAPGLRSDGDGLRDLLVEKLTHSSGELRSGRVAELGFGWGKINSVRLENGEELGAGQVIAALPIADVVALVGKKAPKRLHELAESVRCAGWRYTLNLVVDQSGIPEGMAPTVLAVADPDAAAAGANAFAIHLGEPDDAGRVVVTLTSVLAAPEGGATGEGSGDVATLAGRLADLRRRLVIALDDVMPFVASHIIVAHSPHQDVPPEIPGGRGGHEAPRNLPLPPRPVWTALVPLEATAGLGVLPYATGIKNLTLASSQILPHLGLEGELTAGWSAAKIACAIAGKKRDYLRDEMLSTG